MSYTTFDWEVQAVTDSTVSITVQNTGEYSGKEVLQLYITKPEGRIDHEKKSLASFAKTKLLQPGEKQTLTLSLDLKEIATFDETLSAFILEKGEYSLILNGSPCAAINVDEEILVEQVKPIDNGAHTPYEERFSLKLSALLQRQR